LSVPGRSVQHGFIACNRPGHYIVPQYVHFTGHMHQRFHTLKVELVQFPAVVLRDLKKIAIDVIRDHAEKSPMAKKVNASFTKFQALLAPWDQVAQGVYYQLAKG